MSYRSLRATVVATITLVAIVLIWQHEPFNSLPRGEVRVATLNGTLGGLYLPRFNQDVFLGIPYAQPPVGDLRFRRPTWVQAKWNGVKEAKTYGPHCIGYGERQSKFRKSEDCLTINVVRPSGHNGSPLPVGVYIYGGGTAGGGSSDDRYNLSFLVAHASQVGLDFIGVSFNYRSSFWGFLSGSEVLQAGESNIGIYDQRMALRWIQANIEAFGGDSKKVTIWGGSSGAANVGIHLIAHGGVDQVLFRGAIMQSGGPISATNPPEIEQVYSDVISMTICRDTIHTLACLRTLSVDDLERAMNNFTDNLALDTFAFPVVDGDLVPELGSTLITNLAFAKVPILTGIVSNEGGAYMPGGLHSKTDVARYLTDALDFPAGVANHLLQFYAGLNPHDTKSDNGDLLVGVEALLGDLRINAPNRMVCQTYSIVSNCYSFVFDAVALWSRDTSYGVEHGAEIGAVFQNVEGVGFEDTMLKYENRAYLDMARLIGTMWAGFIVDMDPNSVLGETVWRPYRIGTEEEQHLKFNTTSLGWMEADDRRSQALDYIETIMPNVLMI